MQSSPGPTVSELEGIAALGWRGTTQVRLGDWLLRAGGGFTGRANSVLPLGSPGTDLRRALAAVVAFYSAHGLPPTFQLPYRPDEPWAPDLESELTRRGWSSYHHTAFLTARLPAVEPVLAAGAAVTVDSRPTAQWLAGYHYRGAPLPSTAVAVLESAEDPAFLALHDECGQVAVARAVVDRGWLGVTAVTVAADRRRAGWGRQIMAAALAWGAGRGAHSVYLQVDLANTAALALYRSLGFTEHHRYHYRQRR